jgi:hypothetical protein
MAKWNDRNESNDDIMTFPGRKRGVPGSLGVKGGILIVPLI